MAKPESPHSEKTSAVSWTAAVQASGGSAHSVAATRRDAIGAEAAAQVAPYLSNPDFEPERVAKAHVLGRRCRAGLLFHRITLLPDRVEVLLDAWLSLIHRLELF